MTHLLSREINVATRRAVGKNKTKKHTRKTEQQQFMRIAAGRVECEKAMAEKLMY